MADTVLDVVEEGLGGRTLTRDLVRDLEAETSDNWLEGLWRALRPLDSLTDDELRTYVPERGKDGLQPYLPYRISDGRRQVLGDLPAYEPSWSGPSPGVNNIRAAASAFARHALYCNRIVVDDPIWWVICDGVGAERDQDRPVQIAAADRERLRSRRPSVLAWLELFATIRPLLESGQVVLIPPAFSPYWLIYTTPHIELPNDLLDPELLERVRVEVNESLGFQVPALSDNPDDREIFARGVFHIAVEDMALQLKASDFYQGRLDLSPVGLFHPKALDALMRHGAPTPQSAKSATRQRLALTSLGKLPVFLDAGDDISRLVGLASDDEGFSRWRKGMAKALADIEGLDPTDSYFESRVQAAFEHGLSDAVEALAEAARNATWLGALKKNASALCISALGTGAGTALTAAAGVPVAAPFAAAGTAIALGVSTILTYARGGASRAQGESALWVYKSLTGDA